MEDFLTQRLRNFLPILAGTVVDRYGVKRSLAAFFSIFCVGYFLIGLAGLQLGQSIIAAVGRFPDILAVLMLTAVGGSLIKPSIIGTVARTTTPQTRRRLNRWDVRPITRWSTSAAR